MHGMRASYGVFASLRKAEMANLTLFDQFDHGADDFFDRHLPVDAVLIQQVDVIGAEAFQRSLGRFTHVLGAAVDAGHLAAFDAKAEFAGNHNPLATALERTPDQLFIDERAVPLRGVEKCHAKIDRPMDGRDRFCVVRGAVSMAHTHASEPKGGYLEPLPSQLALLHSCSMSSRRFANGSLRKIRWYPLALPPHLDAARPRSPYSPAMVTNAASPTRRIARWWWRRSSEGVGAGRCTL